MKTLTKLETRVLAKFLAGNTPILGLLREQAQSLQVVSREFSGAGFFTNLFVSDDKPRIPGRPRFVLTAVAGDTPVLSDGIGFALFLEDGALSMIEGFTYGEEWPNEIENLELQYLDTRAQNLKELEAFALKQ
jgi:hypothetical protein